MITRRHFLTGLAALPLAGLLDLPALAVDPVVMPERGLCAHRGCADTFPENTLPAFREAVRLGAQMIEFDVRETRDGALVIMHDDNVKRTTNGEGKVNSFTLAEIRKLDAGSRKGPQFSGTVIPTFEEVLDMMPQNIWLNCDMKSKPASVAEKSARLIAAKNRQHQAFLACYDADMRAAARRALPGIMICNMERPRAIREYVADSVAMKAQFIQFSTKKQGKGGVTAEDLLPLKQNHLRANYFFAREPSELKGLLETGFDFVLVNNLKDFLPAAKTLGIAPVTPKY
jgi:glycerophosphoryl diester phosphodiesterase